MKSRRFSGRPQVRDWAITHFQGEYQVLVVIRIWTRTTLIGAMRRNDRSFTGNRMRISIRIGSLLQIHTAAPCSPSIVFRALSNFLKLWYLVIARVPDLFSLCQFSHYVNYGASLPWYSYSTAAPQAVE